ncbi:MAG: MoaD/ThiS family protein [Sphingorhabdus sp.]
MRLVYFASIREAIGCDSEERATPPHVATIAQCLDWLGQEDARYAAAFSDRAKLRFAVDAEMAKPDAPLASAQELAIFPPVTGG